MAWKNEFNMGGRGGKGGGNRNDALGPRVQELFEFSLYLMIWPGKTNLKLSVTPQRENLLHKALLDSAGPPAAL